MIVGNKEEGGGGGYTLLEVGRRSRATAAVVEDPYLLFDSIRLQMSAFVR